jgi:DNA-binding transcriptional ArsR family regulator
VPEPATPLTPDQLHDTAAVFGVLSATARLQILWLLSAGPRDVGTLAAELDQSVTAVSQHLAKLKLAGLVRAHRQGRHQIYVVDDGVVADVLARVVASRTPVAQPLVERGLS